MRFITLALILKLLSPALSCRAEGIPNIPDLRFTVKSGVFEVVPPTGHHFNVEAPSAANVGKETLHLTIEAHRLDVRLNPSAMEEELSLNVFICDDQNTFCSKKTQTFRIPAIAASSPPSPPLVSLAKSAKAHFEKETGFFVNDPDKAFALAAQKHLPIMIDFFGIWCPPCNHLDAMVFHSPEFKAKTTGLFVRLKLDSDQDRFNELKNRYKIQGLPTVVFTTPSGDEIFRLLGYHPLEEILVKADAAYASRDDGIARIEALASGGDPEARYKAARIALDRDEPAKALKWLTPMKTAWSAAHDPKLADYYRAQFGVAQAVSDKKGARETLEKWIKDFAESPDTVENLQTLAELQESAGDTAGQRASIAAAILLTEKLLAGPASALAGSDYTEADLNEARADLVEKTNDKTRTKQAYMACAAAYQKEALAEGTAFPRGPNLERAYCLSKAGEISKSEAIYREGIRRYPEEYTFHQGMAKLWLETKDGAKALPEARKAVSFAYGNQRLKAMMTLARAFEINHEPQQAVAAIEAELKEPAAQGASPGTLKLRERLRAKAEELRGKSGKSISNSTG